MYSKSIFKKVFDALVAVHNSSIDFFFLVVTSVTHFSSIRKMTCHNGLNRNLRAWLSTIEEVQTLVPINYGPPSSFFTISFRGLASTQKRPYFFLKWRKLQAMYYKAPLLKNDMYYWNTYQKCNVMMMMNTRHFICSYIGPFVQWLVTMGGLNCSVNNRNCR